jgi:predicted CXXCH cytochrome family protein
MIALAVIAALLPGANGKLCLDCHKDFGAKLEAAHVHTPLREGSCTGCHDPHASQHSMLLRTNACASCHQQIVPAAAKSVHDPVAKGACISCHDPHSSSQAFELKKPAAELCASCHQALADASFRAKFKHGATASCSACHDAHASSNAKLLKTQEPALCLSCHSKDLGRSHLGYSVETSQCTSCHDPHGSNRKGMLFNGAHAPVIARQCGDCHAGPKAAQPLALKQQGAALCVSCHRDTAAKIASQSHPHQASLDCLNCHAAHGSGQRALLAGTQRQVCGKCHAESVKRAEASPTRHPPVVQGECTACHDPHGASVPDLLRKADDVEICGKCHDWQKHSSHPIGGKLRDPRNPNLGLSCLSCHRAHGTEFKHMNPYPTTTELCTKCHEQFRR